MRCVILQPSYIPWRGYFRQVAKAELFVFYDDVQYDRRGWRNRNRIKTANGPIWLTVPVLHKGSRRRNTPISEIKINWDSDWPAKHWRAIEQSYAKAPFFDAYAPRIQPLYERRDELLVDLACASCELLAELLGIDGTRFIRSSHLDVSGRKTERLLAVLKAVGGTHYISGPAAKGYIDATEFHRAGITLDFVDYEFTPYIQLHPPYEPNVSVLDLLFMKGPSALDHVAPERGSAQ